MSGTVPPILNRRDILHKTAWLMGGVLSAPAVLAVLNGCTAKPSAASHSLFFSESQGSLVADVAEIMIPRTATPGAKDVGVPDFIASMLRDVYAPADQERFMHGLREFEVIAKQSFGQSFLELGDERRRGFVRKIHDAAVADEIQARASHAPVVRPFILSMKELTMLGFFSSEVGATQVLQYIAVPGAYHGCISIAEAGNGKTWAHETSGAF